MFTLRNCSALILSQDMSIEEAEQVIKQCIAEVWFVYPSV